MKVKISQDLFRKREIPVREVDLNAQEKPKTHEVSMMPPLVQVHRWKGGPGDCPELFLIQRKIKRHKDLPLPLEVEGQMEGVFEAVPQGPGVQLRPRGLSRLEIFINDFSPPAGSLALVDVVVVKDRRTGLRRWLDPSQLPWKDISIAGPNT